MNRPAGWSKWTHREKGGEYTFLTVAKGAGPDHGVEFAYYLGLDKGTGMLHAFVRRLDDWHHAMQPLGADDEQPIVEDGDEDLDDLI